MLPNEINSSYVGKRITFDCGNGFPISGIILLDDNKLYVMIEQKGFNKELMPIESFCLKGFIATEEL